MIENNGFTSGTYYQLYIQAVPCIRLLLHNGRLVRFVIHSETQNFQLYHSPPFLIASFDCVVRRPEIEQCICIRVAC